MLKVLGYSAATLVLLVVMLIALAAFVMTRVRVESAEGEQTAHSLRGMFSYISRDPERDGQHMEFWADFPEARERHESWGMHGQGGSWMYGKLSAADIERLIAHLKEAGLQERVPARWNFDPDRDAPKWWQPRAGYVRSFIEREDGPHHMFPRHGGMGVILIDEQRCEVWIYFVR